MANDAAHTYKENSGTILYARLSCLAALGLWLVQLASVSTITVPTIIVAMALLVVAWASNRFSTYLAVHSLSPESIAYSAAILSLPLPWAMLIAFAGPLCEKDRPLDPRVWNSCSTGLLVGLSGSVCSIILQPSRLLTPDFDGFVRHLPLLLFLLSFMFLLNVVDVSIVNWFRYHLAPRATLEWFIRTISACLYSEVAAYAIGVVFAVLWRYQPLTTVALLVPGVALQSMIRAQRVAERANQLELYSSELHSILEASQQLRFREQAPLEILHILLQTACTLSGARSAAGYLGEGDLVTRMVVIPTDATHLPAQIPDQLGDHDLLLPLLLDGDRQIGALLLCKVTPTSHQRDALSVLAAQSAIAVENAQLHEETLRLARHDGLTGLLNRRSFDERLALEISRLERSGVSLSLLLLDLNDFKQLNDTHGHQIGDEALNQVGQVLRENARGVDAVARLGGDEFALILPGTTLQAATIVAQRIRDQVKRISLQGEAVPPITISCSIGVATGPDDGITAHELVRAADQAMYAGKAHSKRTVPTNDNIRSLRMQKK